MAKFSGLLRNELAKLWGRWTARLLTLFLLLAAAALSGIQWLSPHGTPSVDAEEDSIRALQNQLELLEDEQPEGFETQTEVLLFLLDNGINVNENNWRLAAVQKMSDDMQNLEGLLTSGSEADGERAEALSLSIDRDRELIKTRDYRGYYRKRIADTRGDSTIPAARREKLLWRYQYILDNKVAAEGSEWKYNLMTGMVAAMNELEEQQAMTERGGGVNHAYEKRLQNTIAIAQYRIENEKRVVAGDASSGFYYEEPSRYWQAADISVNAVLLLALAVIILAGGSISGEFSTGTVRQLVAVPVKRGKLLAAKYAAVMLWAVSLLIGFYLANLLASGLFFGFEDAGASYIYVRNDTVRELPGILMIAWKYILASAPLVVYGTAAFCLSALTRNTAVAVGINAFLLFAGPYLVSWLHYNLDQSWARYFIFANLDFNAILSGRDLFAGQTAGSSLFIVGIHMAVFLLTAWDAFVYRDVN